MPYARFLLLCLIWGSSFILMKRAGAALSPWAIGCGRVLTGMTVLLIVAWWQTNRQSVRIARRQVTALIGVMLMGYAIPYAVQPLFIARTQSSSLTAMGVGFTPLLTLAFSIPILGIRPTWKQAVGVLGSLGCLGLLLADTVQRSLSAVDVLLLLSTPLQYALANIWMRMTLSDIPPLKLTTICLGISGVLLFPPALLLPGPLGAAEANWWLAGSCLLVLGVFGTGLGMLMFNQMVRDQGPLFAAMVTNITPIGAVLLGWADAEPVTALQLLALVGVLICVAMVQWGAVRKPA